MPFNGSGSFQRLYSWVSDKANGILINASRMDAEFNGIATALTDCVTRDGQSPATANLPMGGFAHTNVGNATLRNQYAAVGQVQDQAFTWCGTAGGTANAITLAPSPAITSYTAGQVFRFISSAANTGAATVAVSGLATKNITKNGTTALASGDIPNGAVIMIEYDGTQFQLISLPGNLGTVTSVTFTGDGTVLSSTPSSAVTTSGTVTAALATQAKNLVLAGPSSGSNAAPTFRAIVAADMPSTYAQMGQTAAQALSTPGLGGLITVAHGLSVTPKQLGFTLKCTTGEGGWSTNDTMVPYGFRYDNAFPASSPHWNGFALYADGTNVYCRVGDGALSLPRKDTGVAFAITLANWSAILTFWY